MQSGKQLTIDFMKRTGRLPDKEHLTLDILLNTLTQLKCLLSEEIDELNEAIDARNLEEILDARHDINVYLIQIDELLKLAGFKVDESFTEVGINNSLKYTSSKELVNKWVDECGASFRVIEIDVNNETYYHMSDIYGKVRKYKDFPKVDLKPYLPQNLK